MVNGELSDKYPFVLRVFHKISVMKLNRKLLMYISLKLFLFPDRDLLQLHEFGIP